MTLAIVTAKQMQEIDRKTIEEHDTPGIELMEHAGEGVTHEILDVYEPDTVGILCGKGNNAGDGLVVARLLAEAGVEVKLVLLCKPENLSESGSNNYKRLPKKHVAVFDHEALPKLDEVFEDCEVVVDALLGTGITGAPRGSVGEAIAAVNDLWMPIVAIDIPSGLNADDGSAEGACIFAERTVTMGLPKRGMYHGAGPEMCGEIVPVDIGFPEDLLAQDDFQEFLVGPDDVRACLPSRPREGHKGTFGGLLAITGSVGMSGAAFLTCASALRSGCGMVYAAMPAEVERVLAGRLIETVNVPLYEEAGRWVSHEDWGTIEPYLEKATAIALGPGLGTREETARLVDELVCQDLPMVIDADALNCLGEKVQYLTKRPAPTVLTPHPGEMGRLMNMSASEVQANRWEVARRLATETGTHVLLKGCNTLIADPDGEVYVIAVGNTGLSKGGCGDVLTGLIGGLLAQGLDPLDAACTGAWVHGMSAEVLRESYGTRGMTAQDVLAGIPGVLGMLETL